MNSSLLFTVAIFMVLTAPATAGKTVDRDSLVAAPVEIFNSGAAPILCQAEIAHWFATDLAENRARRQRQPRPAFRPAERNLGGDEYARRGPAGRASMVWP